MKFLKDERIEIEDGEVKLTIRPITTSQQARLLELGFRRGIVAVAELAGWCLLNCIERISVNGTEYKPAKLAEKADMNDDDTAAVMRKIGTLVCGAAWPSGEDVKK